MTDLKTLYVQAKAFFEANPDKWTTGSMSKKNGCMCYAGAMALIDNPEFDSGELASHGWDLSARSIREHHNSIVHVNDSSKSLAEATARLDKVFGVC